MGGSVLFEVALQARLDLIRPSRAQVDQIAAEGQLHLTPRIAELVARLLELGKRVCLVSGGFRQMIAPVAARLGIDAGCVFANQLLFDDAGAYAGFDATEFTSRSGGKGRAIEHIKNAFGCARVVMIGDGATDLEARPPADIFIGFGGVVEREAVRLGADWFVRSFDELIQELSAEARPAGYTAAVPANSGKLGIGSISLGAHDAHSCCAVDAESWLVRACGYAEHKVKQASLPSLCALAGADLFASERKIVDIGQRLNLPHPPFLPECERLGLPQPPVFVVNILLPAYEPANPLWGTAVSDGRGHALVLYFTLCEQALKEWQTPDSDVAAINLLRRFVAAELDDDRVHERLKAIARVQNVAECGFGRIATALVNEYNGTPFLSRPQHRFFRGASYFEMDIDVHSFSYAARSGLHEIHDRIASIVFELAIVIEGHADDELPEAILGCARLSRLDLERAVALPAELSGDGASA